MAANGGIKEFFRWDNLWDNPQDNPRTTSKNGTTSKKFRRTTKKLSRRLSRQLSNEKVLKIKEKTDIRDNRTTFLYRAIKLKNKE